MISARNTLPLLGLLALVSCGSSDDPPAAGAAGAGVAGAGAGAGGAGQGGAGGTGQGGGGAGGKAGSGGAGGKEVVKAPPFPEGTGQEQKIAAAYPPPPYGVGIGSTLANQVFTGLANAKLDPKTEVVIRFSDFYNPTGKGTYPAGSPMPEGQPKPKILLVDVSSVWCPPCNHFSDVIAPVLHEKYGPQGVEFLLLLVDGPTPGKPVTMAQLRAWDKKYGVDFPSVLDPLSSTQAIWPSNAFPSMLVIDTRTMKLVASLAGIAEVEDKFWQEMEAALAKDTSTGAGGEGGAGGNGSGGNGGQEDDPSCSGGVIVDGVCEGKCSPEKCLAGNTCVGNRCVLVCDSHSDCATDGTQRCAPAIEDGSKAEIHVCQPSGKQPGLGMPCPNVTECDGLQACPDGTPCDAGGCAPELCKPLVCTGNVKYNMGQYCTMPDCVDDASCPGGFTCESIRDPHELCGSDPKKGNGGVCGTTTEACVAAADFTKDGGTFSESDQCLLRKRCVKRGFCFPCEVDLDCGNVPGGRCVDIAGSKRCSPACAETSDCPVNAECVGGSCLPRGGSCEGEGKLCDICQTDGDCPGGICGGTGRERLCIPMNAATPCKSDADCPKVKSGKQSTCLNEAQQAAPGDPLYGVCYAPIDPDTNISSCW